MHANHLARRRGSRWLAASALILVSMGGCARAEVRLLQPNAPPVQQDIKLAADWAYVSRDGERRECLLDFPLPLAKAGPRDFRLFLSLALGDGLQAVSADDPAAARGFFIQAVGSRRGKTVFTGGTVRLDPIPLDRRHSKLQFDLTCEDGSQITGSAKLLDDEAELRAFKRRFAPDIAALDGRAAEGAKHAADDSQVSEEDSDASGESTASASAVSADEGETTPARRAPTQE